MTGKRILPPILLTRAFRTLVACGTGMLMWFAPHISAAQSPYTPDGRQQLIDGLFDVAFRGDAQARLFRWARLPKVAVINAAPAEEALVRDVLTEYSKPLLSDLMLADSSDDPKIIIFFLDNYTDIAEYKSVLLRCFGVEGASGFSVIYEEIFQLQPNRAFYVGPWALSRDFGIRCAPIVMVKNHRLLHKRLLMIGMATSLGLRGNTNYISVKSVAMDKDFLSDGDIAMLYFMYNWASPGMSWPEVQILAGRFYDEKLREK